MTQSIIKSTSSQLSSPRFISNEPIEEKEILL